MGVPNQVELGAAELGENPLAPTELLKELEVEDGPEEPKGPTMMSREARQLMLSGQGQAGLQAWKVGISTPVCTSSGKPGGKFARKAPDRFCSR
jgi:hypothetical protein